MRDFLNRLFGDSGKTKGDKPAKGKALAPAPSDARGQALAQIRENQDKIMTPDRAELIRQAMEVRRAKQQILADLSDTQKQKLAAMAIRAFLNEGREEEGNGKAAPRKPPEPAAAKDPGKNAKGRGKTAK